MLLADPEMETPTGMKGFTVNTTALEVAGLPVVQARFEVRLHETTSPLAGRQLNTGALVPAQAYGQLTSLQLMFIFSALIIPIFSALRLAKFNIDTRQSDSFIGLPTPANALFISALGLISEHGSFPAIDHSILNSWALLAMTLLFSGLLVSEVAMFALKFKNLSWKENHIRYIFLFLSAIMVASFPIYGIAAAILLFILISVLAGKRQVNP